MNNKKKPRKIDRLKHKYRFVILNDDTFEEKLSFRLSRLNVYTVFGVGSLFLIALVIVLIAFTPFREFMPGDSDCNLRKTGIENTIKIDSLENILRQKEQYLQNINKIIQGEPLVYNDTVVIDSNLNYKNIVNEKIPEDSL